MTSYAPAVVRIGLALVFLWFGFSQLADAQSWLGWLPDWLPPLPVSDETLVLLNGGFEVVFGVLLLLGFLTRQAAGLLALHMILIVLAVGYNAIGVRDFGLFLATASVFLHGPDRLTLDWKFHRASAAGG